MRSAPAEPSAFARGSAPLRVLAWIPGKHLARWQVEVVDSLAREPGLSLDALLVPRDPSPEPRARDSLYERADRALHAGAKTPFAMVDVSGRWSDIPRLPATRELAATPERRLPDVIVALAGSTLDSEDGGWDTPEERARHGVWTLSFGDRGAAAEVAPYLEAMAGKRATVEIRLETHGSTGHRVLERTTCPVHPYSLIKSRSMAISAAAPMFLRRLRLLRDQGPESRVFRDAPAAPVSRPVPGQERRPGTLLAATARALLAAAGRLAERVLIDEYHWSVAIAPRTGGVARQPALPSAPFHRVSAPAGCFLADPFLFEHAGGEFLFAELYPYDTGHGVIASSRVDARGRAGTPRVVLERPYHLSYPQVFRWKDEILMLPETSGNRTIELYRCERFPDRWVLDQVLLEDLLAFDATLLEHQGRWWLFACVAPPGLLGHTELHLWFADGPRGPWRSHPMNPVVSDVRCARPAGRLFESDGAWIRPGQDCAVRYGHAVSFSRVRTLTVDDYEEEVVGRITPENVPWMRGARGIHTWNSSPGFHTVDVSVARWKALRRWAR